MGQPSCEGKSALKHYWHRVFVHFVGMKHSNSLILAWRVAAVEARHLKAPAIEPTHLLLGLCKVVDVDLPELVSKTSPDRDEVLEELLREVRKLRTVFRAAGLNAKVFRRRLRRALPNGQFSLAESGRLSRSPASKTIFANAERFAQLHGSTVYPVHLLYATLRAEDRQRDTLLAELNVEKKNLINVVNREVLMPHIDSLSASKKAKIRWN